MIPQVIRGCQLESHGRESFPIWSTNVSKGNSLEGHAHVIQEGQVSTAEARVDKGLHEITVIGT